MGWVYGGGGGGWVLNAQFCPFLKNSSFLLSFFNFSLIYNSSNNNGKKDICT